MATDTVTADTVKLLDAATARLGGAIVGSTVFRGQAEVEVGARDIISVLRLLKDDPELAFDCLADLTCVDYLEFPEPKPGRFGIVYILRSTRHGRILRIKVYLPAEDPEIPSASGIWKAADWAEREIYDMYGVFFGGHPDLRRILMPEGYEGHPLRKDYPVKGRGERDNFPVYSPAEDKGGGGA